MPVRQKPTDFCIHGHDLKVHERTNKKGYTYCKECTRLSHHRRYRTNTDYYRQNHKLSRYGLSVEDYKRIFEDQGGQCAICGNTLILHHKHTHVDHCHATDKVRGILCHGCNTGIGSLHDNVDLLRKAITYLEKE